jgi:multiple antibiotic resistance protein
MHVLLSKMLFAFLALFPILNPPAMAPVFLQLTGHVSDRERNRLAFLIGIYTFGFLTGLLFIGGWALKLLGISIPVISIAGGLLLFHSAWHMLNKDPRMSDQEKAHLQSCMLDQAFVPLTLPVTAGPGAMAVTLSLVPSGNLMEPATLLRYAGVASGIAMAAIAVFIFYRFSGAVIRKMGKTGEATLSQVSAFVLLAIGVQIVWNGLRELIRGL